MFLKIANSKGIKTISFIDHWTNLKQRFKLQEQYIYPEQILVIDQKAKNLAINEGIEECAQLVKKTLEKSGIKSEILRLKNVAPIVYGEVKSKKNPRKTLMFYNHPELFKHKYFETYLIKLLQLNIASDWYLDTHQPEYT